MAATFRAASSATGTGGGDTTVTTPTGTASGDIIIMFGGSDSSSGFSDPVDASYGSNFTTLEIGNDASTHSWVIAFLELTAAPAADYTFNSPGSGHGIHLLTFQESGGGWTTPDTAGLSSANNGIGTDATTTSLTASTNDAIACAFGNDGNQTRNVDPSTMTITSQASQGSYGITAYYEDGLASGSFTRTQTYNTSDDWSALAVILREAGGAAANPKGVLGGLVLGGPFGGPIG